MPLTEEIEQLSFAYMDEELSFQDLTSEGIIGAVLTGQNGDNTGPDADMVVVVLRSRGDYFHRVGLLRVQHFHCLTDNEMPYTAYRVSSSGKLLDELDYDALKLEFSLPLWHREAKRRVIRIG
jgi:hypothetical protein